MLSTSSGVSQRVRATRRRWSHMRSGAGAGTGAADIGDTAAVGSDPGGKESMPGVGVGDRRELIQPTARIIVEEVAWLREPRRALAKADQV